jgi:hypothetical protein
MAKIVEILDSAGIDSAHIESWIEESFEFMEWYIKLGIHEFNPVSLELACLGLLTRKEISETTEAEKLRLQRYVNIDLI